MRRPDNEPRDTGPRRTPRAFLFFLLTAGAFLGACEDPVVLGVHARELRDMLSAGDRSVLLSAPIGRLGELSRLGPGALYYAARAVGLSGDTERAAALLRLAAEKESGLFRRRAWELLPDLLYSRGDWAGLLEFSDRQSRAGIDAYAPRIRRAESLAALGRTEEARGELDALAADYPAEYAADAALTAALRLRTAATAEERAARTRELFALPDARAGDLAEALTAATEAPAPYSEAELALFRLRSETARRDYGAAYRALAPRAGEILTPALPRAFLTDAGKAYLYAPALEEGIAAMTALETLAGAERSTRGREALYLAQFYRARMLLRLERYSEAARDFARAYEAADSGQDRDAAAWYRAESLLPSGRGAAADWLAQAAADWSDPASFADLIERLARQALLARDGAVLYKLRVDVAPRMSLRASSRLVYLAARAAQLGIAAIPAGAGTAGGSPPTAIEYAEAAFREVYARSPEPYYRLLAAHRLGLPLIEVPAARTPAQDPKDSAPVKAGVQKNEGPDPESYLTGFVDYGMTDLLAPEIRALRGSPDAPAPESLRRIAARLRDRGDTAASMLVINRLLEDPGYEASREDWELLWPRPWPAEVAESAALSGMEEHVLYGLIRSESFFLPAVVSRAGAVGLAQLMPATAAETARRLRMDAYDLENPADNIRLGSAHFAGLLRALDGRVLPSVFAYNAGLSRVRGWERAAPGFPDDLFLESLSIEETRQYGRNVLWASTVYGMLWYGLDAEAALTRMLGELR